jgi:hypothetical protein
MASGGGGSKSVDKAAAKGKKIAREVESDEAPTSLIALGGYKPLPGVLRFVIVVDPVENIRNYALVPFPETYEVCIDVFSFVAFANPNTLYQYRKPKKQP